MTRNEDIEFKIQKTLAEICEFIHGDDNNLQRCNSIMHTLGPIGHSWTEKDALHRALYKDNIQVHGRLLVIGAEQAYQVMRSVSYIVL